jgi:hypothetical protein
MSLSSVENAAPHRLFPTLNAVHGLRSAAVIGTRYGASLQICASADDIWINKERRRTPPANGAATPSTARAIAEERPR